MVTDNTVFTNPSSKVWQSLLNDDLALADFIEKGYALNQWSHDFSGGLGNTPAGYAAKRIRELLKENRQLQNLLDEIDHASLDKSVK